MQTDTHRITAPIDRLHSTIDHGPTLLDLEFDQDLDDLERAFAEFRELRTHL